MTPETAQALKVFADRLERVVGWLDPDVGETEVGKEMKAAVADLKAQLDREMANQEMPRLPRPLLLMERHYCKDCHWWEDTAERCGTSLMSTPAADRKPARIGTCHFSHERFSAVEDDWCGEFTPKAAPSRNVLAFSPGIIHRNVCARY